MVKIKKTTKTDFEIFKKHFLYYQDMFELSNYHCLFFHEVLKTAYARTKTDNDHYVTRVSLATTWEEREISEKELKQCALHEVLHLLISKISWLGGCRYVTELEIENADEEFAVKLANILSKVSLN